MCNETEMEVIEREQIEIGEQLAEIFQLKKAKGYKDRYETTWGTKTAMGIYAVAARLIKGG
jgi:hypothetical protein